MLAVTDDLSAEARDDLMTLANEIIAQTVGPIDVDCSALTRIDEPIVGMLALLTRQAQRSNRTVVLSDAPVALVTRLDDANILERFSIEPARPSS